MSGLSCVKGLVLTAQLFVVGVAAGADWTGGSSTDWNTAANWSGSAVPLDNVEGAFINRTYGNIATISANIPTPNHIEVGTWGNWGRLDHTAGSAATGDGDWLCIGLYGNGTYNLADTATTGGLLTGFGTGSGSMIVATDFNVGFGNGTGTANMNSGGTLSANFIGVAAGSWGDNDDPKGTLNLDAGTLTSRLWGFRIADVDGATTGVVNQAGGMITVQNGSETRIGSRGCGTMNQSGGALVASGLLGIGSETTGTGIYNLTDGTVGAYGELWVGCAGVGTMSQSGGTVNSHGWMVLSRWNVGNGTYNLSGGTVNAATNVGSVTIASAGGTGALNVSGGSFSSGDNIFVGEGYENAGGSGTLRISGTGSVTANNDVRIALNSSVSGTACLDGGSLTARRVTTGSGTGSFSFNGGVLSPRDSREDWFDNSANLSTVVRNGGAVIDTAGFDVTLGESLAHSAVGGDNPVDGGLTKRGAGTLTLSGANTYNGATVVAGGTLAMGSASAIPANSALELLGGRLNLGGYALNSSSVTATSGSSIVNGSLATPTVTALGDYQLELGTVSGGNGNAYTGGLVVSAGTLKVARRGLAHRWSFNGSLADSAGGSTATTHGSVTTDGNQYTLAGGGKDTSYISLGSYLLPMNDAPFTVELWATQRAVQNWSRIFDFGADTDNYLTMSWTVGTETNSDLVELKGGGVNSQMWGAISPYTIDEQFHIAMVVEPGLGVAGNTVITCYKFNAAGTLLRSGTISTTWRPSQLDLTNMWLGHSEYWDNDASASYNEVRLWNGALAQNQLAANTTLGPDALPANILLTDAQVASATVEAGAVLDLDGGAVSFGDLAGSGVVTNGQMTVTGTLAPAGTLTVAGVPTLAGTLRIAVAADGSCAQLAVTGALDLSRLSLEVNGMSNLRRALPNVIAKCAPGGLTGSFRALSLSKPGWSVSYHRVTGEVNLTSAGTLICLQ